MIASEFVQVVVGGLPYSISVSDIQKFPGSFFECMIKKEWMTDENKPIVIERDGALFKYINGFLVNDHLPRDERGLITLNEDTLERLKVEADFFGLEALSNECMIVHKKFGVGIDEFTAVRRYLSHITRSTETNLKFQYSSELIKILKGAWAPLSVKGTIHQPDGIHELIVDTKTAWANEIPASELNADFLRIFSQIVCLADFAPHLKLELRPYKLVICPEGAHIDAHRDTVREDGHIGTLVIVLNSEYTGGELEVSHGGHTEVVLSSFNWIALYNDCQHKIHPVTSGTHMSMIYDIYGTVRDSNRKFSHKERYLEQEENKEEKSYFWDNQFNPNSTHHVTVGCQRLCRSAQTAIMTALDIELSTHDSLIITLQHLYPECQSSPAFLKGGDRALYDLLSEQYDVQVVALTFTYIAYTDNDRSEDMLWPNHFSTTCALFSPNIVKCSLNTVENTKAIQEHVVTHNTKVFITNQFDEAGLLEFVPYAERSDDGLDFYGEENTVNRLVSPKRAIYVVSGLQVQKRGV